MNETGCSNTYMDLDYHMLTARAIGSVQSHDNFRTLTSDVIVGSWEALCSHSTAVGISPSLIWHYRNRTYYAIVITMSFTT